jgi:hypothetical protein
MGHDPNDPGDTAVAMTEELVDAHATQNSTPAAGQPEAPAVGNGRPASHGLAAMAPVVRLGFLLLGVAAALRTLSEPAASGPSANGHAVVSGSSALVSLIGYSLIGWILGRLLPAIAEWLADERERAAGARRTAAILERALIPALNRLTDAMERPAASPPPPERPRPDDALGEIRLAIRERRLADADERLRAFRAANPEHPDGPRLAGECDAARQRAIVELHSHVDAARSANDPERVLELRGELAVLLEPEPLLALDRDLAKWFLVVVHKRLRAGLIRPALAELVARVAAGLGGTPEGASLRAALPTIRRSAGLCARCAKPYTGVADACPQCLGVPVPDSAAAPPDGEDAGDDDIAPDDRDDPGALFV